MLEAILAHKRKEIEEAKRRQPVRTLEAEVTRLAPPRSLLKGITGVRGPAHRIIAEIKRASPSKGVLRQDLDPLEWAERYERAGAIGLSVLTDTRFFKGSLDDLIRIRDHVELPLLRKDFLIDPYQVLEARVGGADVVLLIMRVLEDGQFANLLRLAQDLGMEALVEVHDERDLDRALTEDSRLVGINNRDLSTFTVDLSVTERLMAKIPLGIVAVSASGIQTPEQVRSLESKGVKAFLVGEALVTAGAPEKKLRELVT
jgi:indole-3-glycerol phosphate synthase